MSTPTSNGRDRFRPAARPGTIGEQLERSGVSRRSFLELCGKLAALAPFGLALTETTATAASVASAIEGARRPSVIWLHFQDCTGCSETLLRPTEPDLAHLVFDLISLDYHETLMVAAGHRAEAALHQAMHDNDGEYVLIVEGSIPTRHRGRYMTVAGKTAIDTLAEVAEGAAAVIAIGSCAAFGGMPSADPNPTGAVGVNALVTDRPVINLPGCPPSPYTLLGVVLQYVIGGSLPALDELNRPLFAYDRMIHDHCPRRPHFDAGRFADQFGDDGHRSGWCLYKLGCKGPDTHARCSTHHFNEIVGAWPIGIGAPCIGCTEEHLAFKVPMFDLADIHHFTPPTTYPATEMPTGRIDPVATGLVGLAAGAVAGGTYVASRRFSNSPLDAVVPGGGEDDDHEPPAPARGDRKGDPS